MEYRNPDVRKLTRSERIKEEAKRALEYGQVPKRPLSLHPTFRVEGLTSTVPHRVQSPGTRCLELARMKVVTSRRDNPLLPKEGASYIAARIDTELQRLTPSNRAQRASELLELVGLLQAIDPHRESTLTLFRSEKELPKERGPLGRGGAVGPESERRD